MIDGLETVVIDNRTNGEICRGRIINIEMEHFEKMIAITLNTGYRVLIPKGKVLEFLMMNNLEENKNG